MSSSYLAVRALLVLQILSVAAGASDAELGYHASPLLPGLRRVSIQLPNLRPTTAAGGLFSLRGGSSSDPYKVQMQIMITRSMRKILIEDLNYLPEEVDDMEPQIAKVVIDKSLPRPRAGMPVAWRRSVRVRSQRSRPFSAAFTRMRLVLESAIYLPVRLLTKVKVLLPFAALTWMGYVLSQSLLSSTMSVPSPLPGPESTSNLYSSSSQGTGRPSSKLSTPAKGPKQPSQRLSSGDGLVEQLEDIEEFQGEWEEARGERKDSWVDRQVVKLADSFRSWRGQNAGV